LFHLLWLLSIKQLVDEFGIDKETFVYSFDVDQNKIVVGKAFNFHKTINNAELIEIILDNGQSIRCTKNHKFMLIDGSYKEAQNLQCNESLMPIYFDRYEGSFCDGYKRCWSNDGKKHFVHRLVAKMKFGKEWTRGFINHHDDFNKDNNHPNNIKLLTGSEHSILHRRADCAKYLIEYNKSEEGRIMASIIGRRNMKLLWQKHRGEQIKNCKENGMLGAEAGKIALGKYNESEEAIEAIRERNIDGTITKSKILRIAKRIMDYGLSINENTWFEHMGYKSNPSFSTAILHFGTVDQIKINVDEKFKFGNMVKAKSMKVTKRIIEANLPINENTWDEHRHSINNPDFCTAIKTFGTLDNLIFETEKKYQLKINHKVVSAKVLDVKEDVYDFTVDKYHNFALDAGVFVHNSWWMSKKKPGEKWGPGGKLTKKPEPHYKEDKKKKKKSSVNERIAQVVDDIFDEVITMPEVTFAESNKSYSTVDTVKQGDGYITIKTNYKEENGQPVLEEYIVDKNGNVETYDNTEAFVARLASEGLF